MKIRSLKASIDTFQAVTSRYIHSAGISLKAFDYFRPLLNSVYRFLSSSIRRKRLRHFCLCLFLTGSTLYGWVTREDGTCTASASCLKRLGKKDHLLSIRLLTDLKSIDIGKLFSQQRRMHLWWNRLKQRNRNWTGLILSIPAIPCGCFD